VLEFMSAIVWGKLPHLPTLLPSTLLPISLPIISKLGGRIQPIALGEVCYHLAGACALATCKDDGRSLAPLQLVVSVPHGAQMVGHALAAGIASKPSCLMSQLDLWTTFNMSSRQ
jgi:hypothetical protein